MIIFAAMLIPFITALVLWIKFQRQTKWWEFFIPFVVSIIVASLMSFATSYISAQKDEYWTGWITRADYFEAWNEKVYYTEEVEDGYKTVKGSDGKYHKVKKYKTVKKSRIDNHSAYWTANDSNGASYSIDSSTYKDFVHRWGREVFTELNRNYYTKDGDQYTINFDGLDGHMEVASSIHSYENKVVLSRSVFNFPKVTPEQKKEFSLIDYPPLSGNWEMPCVLGEQVPGTFAAEKRLSVFNARMGRAKQVRVWLLIFKGQPLEAAYQQQNYWKNGNMNEFTLCLGVDKENKVQWGHTFSWTDKSDLIVEGRNALNEQKDKKLDLGKVTTWIENNIPNRWERKNFKRDFKYINIAPPWWAILVTFIIVGAINVALSAWITQNEFSEDQDRTGRGFRKYG